MAIRWSAERAATDPSGQSRFFNFESEGGGTDLDGLVSDVTTITQSWCEHATDYADMGMREDMYARSGPASFVFDTTRERIPTGSTHRYQIGTLSVAEIWEMLRNTTRMLIVRARQNGELAGSVFAAIDVTKGFPFTGDVENHQDDSPGYKDGN